MSCDTCSKEAARPIYVYMHVCVSIYIHVCVCVWQDGGKHEEEDTCVSYDTCSKEAGRRQASSYI